MTKYSFENYLLQKLQRWHPGMKSLNNIGSAIENNEFITTIASLVIKKYVDALSEEQMTQLCKEFQVSECTHIDLEIALIDKYVIQHVDL